MAWQWRYTSERCFTIFRVFWAFAAVVVFSFVASQTTLPKSLISGLSVGAAMNLVSLLLLLPAIVLHRMVLRWVYRRILPERAATVPLPPVSRIVLIIAAFFFFCFLSEMPCFSLRSKDFTVSGVILGLVPLLAGVGFYQVLKFAAGLDRRKKP